MDESTLYDARVLVRSLDGKRGVITNVGGVLPFTGAVSVTVRLDDGTEYDTTTQDAVLV